ncbi:hypothetical protein ILYODFUR_025830 [Ilyodon furcidens]|uniref:Uncharacterized protein n=2 Tax=Goodeidae TaxID=28758 RepID=A0ABV0U8G2_9TELE
MLFKIEAAVKLGLNHQSNTRTACVWHCYYKEKVTPKRVADMDFSKPKHGRVMKARPKRIRPVFKQDREKELAATP